jgi:integrase
LLTTQPRIHKFREAAARSGFFEADSYLRVMRHLPSDALRLACEIMFSFGWRKGEVLGLQRRQVNFDEADYGTLRLDAGSTKNDDPRIVPLTPTLRGSIAEQLAKLDAWQTRSGRKTQYLFTHTDGRHEGQRILGFVKVWKSACLAAELEGLSGDEREKRKRELLARPEGLMKALRHDFRRTAVRNLLNAGTPERVAMRITGHRSANVFKRYHIVNLSDLQTAVLRLPTPPDLKMLGGEASESDKAK